MSKSVIKQMMIFISTNNQLTKVIEPELIKLWVIMLGKYSDSLIKDAVYKYLKSDESKYDKGKMPQIGAIISRIEEIYTGSKEAIEDLAQQQWSLYQEKYYRRDNDLTEASEILDITRFVIKSMGGGYSIFNMATEQNLIFSRKEFIAKFLDRYRAEKLAELENGVALLGVDKKQAIEKAENLRLESIKSANLGDGLFNHSSTSKIRPKNLSSEVDMVLVNR